MRMTVVDLIRGFLMFFIGWGLAAGIWLTGWLTNILEFLQRLLLEMENTGSGGSLLPAIIVMIIISLVMMGLGKLLFRSGWITILISGIIYFLSLALFVNENQLLLGM